MTIIEKLVELGQEPTVTELSETEKKIVEELKNKESFINANLVIHSPE